MEITRLFLSISLFKKTQIDFQSIGKKMIFKSVGVVGVEEEDTTRIRPIRNFASAFGNMEYIFSLKPVGSLNWVV